jgi:hypothetical protein
MYTALKHTHLLTAVLSLLLTVLWSALAWRARSTGDLRGRARAVYIIHRASAGLAGLSGLAVTFIGPWRLMLFPYVGLAAFIAHGLAASVSRRSLGAGQDAVRRTALLAQIAALLFSAYVMSAKTF